MNVTRFAAAPPYPAPPDHHGMTCLWLQGHDAGPSQALWMGVSQVGPGGSIERGASPLEKHYVVLSGEVTIVTGDGEAALGPWDSVCLASGEARALETAPTRRLRCCLRCRCRRPEILDAAPPIRQREQKSGGIRCP